MENPRGPPTEKQKAYIQKKGRTVPDTKEDASKLIDEIIGGSPKKSVAGYGGKPHAPAKYDEDSKLFKKGYDTGVHLVNIRGGVEKACAEAGITAGIEVGAIYNNVVNWIIHNNVH